MSYRQIKGRLSKLEAEAEEPGRVLLVGMHWPLPKGFSKKERSLRIDTVLTNEKVDHRDNDLVVGIKEYGVECADRLIRQ